MVVGCEAGSSPVAGLQPFFSSSTCAKVGAVQCLCFEVLR